MIWMLLIYLLIRNSSSSWKIGVKLSQIKNKNLFTKLNTSYNFLKFVITTYNRNSNVREVTLCFPFCVDFCVKNTHEREWRYLLPCSKNFPFLLPNELLVLIFQFLVDGKKSWFYNSDIHNHWSNSVNYINYLTN